MPLSAGRNTGELPTKRALDCMTRWIRGTQVGPGELSASAASWRLTRRTSPAVECWGPPRIKGRHLSLLRSSDAHHAHPAGSPRKRGKRVRVNPRASSFPANDWATSGTPRCSGVASGLSPDRPRTRGCRSGRPDLQRRSEGRPPPSRSDASAFVSPAPGSSLRDGWGVVSVEQLAARSAMFHGPGRDGQTK